MKYLFSVFVVMVFVLSGCINLPESPQENFSTARALKQDLQEGTPAETDTGGDVSANSIEIVGGNEESLRDFIEHWLAPGSTDDSSRDRTVYIGNLPEDLPYDLPIPDDARIIGSMTGGWVDYILIFETGLPSKSIHEFYVQNLTDEGWREALMNRGPGGFVSQVDLYSGYCHEGDDSSLSVETLSISDTQTSSRLNLEFSPAYNCDPAAISSGSVYEKLMPHLGAPGGARILSSGASSSDRETEITAHLLSDLSPVKFVEFYNQQLLAFGWKMQDSGDVQANGNGEGAAWSHWTFMDELETDWLGSLIVVKTSANSDRLFALLRIEKDK